MSVYYKGNRITSAGVVNYNQLDGKPSINGQTLQGNINVGGVTDYSQLTGKPSINGQTLEGDITVGGNVTLNGSQVTNPSFYAPTAAGMSGQVLQSNGANSAPTWTDMVMAGMPTGMIMPFAGAIAPSGWLKCDGSAVSRTTFKALYDVIGTTYGSGDGTSTFNLPNLVGRFLEGASSTTSGHALGASVNAGLPDHNHTFTGTKDIKTSSTTPSMTFTGKKVNTETAGSHAHNYYFGGGTAGSGGTSNGDGHQTTKQTYTGATATAGSHSHEYTAEGTISGGAHTHTLTPAGTIDKASAHNSVYGNSTTVQPASVCVNYLIRY